MCLSLIPGDLAQGRCRDAGLVTAMAVPQPAERITWVDQFNDGSHGTLLPLRKQVTLPLIIVHRPHSDVFLNLRKLTIVHSQMGRLEAIASITAR
eukprot:2235689-Prymnesium_polylepis.1